MAWFRLEGRGAFHRKVVAAGNAAYGAWCRAGQWSAYHLTDGAIPRAVALTIASARIWDRLVEVRLCEVTPDGWRIRAKLSRSPK